MLWVWICVGIAVVGLVMVVSYAIWLWHKASDVWAEVDVVFDRLGQLGDLAGQIRLPDSFGGVGSGSSTTVATDAEFFDEGEDIDEGPIYGNDQTPPVSSTPRRARTAPNR